MEPTETSISFLTTVKKVQFKKRLRRAWKDGDNIQELWEDLGWFILFEGSWEYLHAGKDKPPFEPTDTVRITITRT